MAAPRSRALAALAALAALLALLPTPALAAVEGVRGLAMMLTKEHDFAFSEVRAGNEAHEIFCQCRFNEKTDGRGLAEMCPGITQQCKTSFCKPLCLRMAWQPRIDYKCERAKTWSWCERFAVQARAAEKAITAQFQAFTCMNLHFCNETEHVYQWIENHAYGNQYPRHHLPIDACSLNKNATQQQTDLLCKACERVVDVSIERGECLPQFRQLVPGSLQERCLYMADAIGQRKSELMADLKASVCSCLGCCGTGKCIFRNPEENWLSDLVADVSAKVTAQLELDGWATYRHPHYRPPKQERSAEEFQRP
jgi:hypothetical protein